MQHHFFVKKFVKLVNEDFSRKTNFHVLRPLHKQILHA